MPRIENRSRATWVGRALVVAWILSPALWAQTTEDLAPSDSLFPSASQAGQKEQQPATLNQLPQEQLAEVEDWMSDLGSKEFARRERAASRLTEIGAPILPRLRQLANDSDDPEVRLRADEIVKQLTQGDMQEKINDFLSGAEVDLEGWDTARRILGDSDGVRELYIELLRAHPDVTTSLEGLPRDRAMAMDKAVSQVQNAMFIERRFPSRADAFALLLPAVDPNVPLNAAFESVLLSVLQKDAASKIRRDSQLSGPFRRLLGAWMMRSTLASRDDVLLFGMSWDVDATLPLAIQTLGEANQTETLAFALQAIARFGTREHAERLLPLLDDTRPSSERGFARAGMTETQLGDVAMAAIAVLYKVPLSEIGFKRAETHPTYGFILTDLGFPADDDESRRAARAKIDELLRESPEAEGS